jgi:hypothetical protein
MVNLGLRKKSSLVDLRKCKPGDKLLSVNGMVLTYIGRLENQYMDHMIQYPNGSYGSRTHDGFVFRKNHQPEDHDIIMIL